MSERVRVPETPSEKALRAQIEDLRAELANLMPLLVREQEQSRSLSKELSAFMDERNKLQDERDELNEQLTELTDRPPVNVEDLRSDVYDILEKVLPEPVQLTDRITAAIKDYL
jgi:uncharacterized coiled-coil DUF342 family protein